MRKTTKQVQVRGTTYAVAVLPRDDSTWAYVMVDGQHVGMVQQFDDKSGYVFVGPAHTDLRYSANMLREVQSAEAWRVHEAKEFAAEVEAYAGPMDVTFDTTECVDCGEQVLKSTPEQPVGYAECTGASGHYRGHRVSGEVYRAWLHQKKVIAAVLASKQA